MPFSDRQVARTYREVIEPALREAGLQPNRADERYGADVMHDIWAGLNEARIVVADLTRRNPNVFYELGVAHTLGKPLVLLSADGGRKIPFDINRFRHILYRETPRGLATLRQALTLTVAEVLKSYPTGHLLINEVESHAVQWRSTTRDFSRLLTEERLNHLRDFLRPEDLSDYAVTLCAASACHYGLPGHMLYWGGLCNRRPGAAVDLVFALFDAQRRPPLRVAHLLAQFDTEIKQLVLGRMAEHGVPTAIRTSIEVGNMSSYVRQRYRALGLSVGERDELLTLFSQVLLRPRDRQLLTATQ